MTSKRAESVVEEDGGIPPWSDSRWESWSRPLLNWMGEEGRTWEEIREWGLAAGRTMTLLRQMIVWLEDKGKIEAIRTSEKSSRTSWLWRRVHGTLTSCTSKPGGHET